MEQQRRQELSLNAAFAARDNGRPPCSLLHRYPDVRRQICSNSSKGRSANRSGCSSGWPKPAHTLRLELVDVRAEPTAGRSERSNQSRVSNPAKGMVWPFRHSPEAMLLGGCGRAALAMHREKTSAREVRRVDLDRHAEDKRTRGLGCRTVDLEERIDVARWTHDLNRMRAVDFRYSFNGLVEIAGAHDAFLPDHHHHPPPIARHQTSGKEVPPPSSSFCAIRTILRMAAIALLVQF